MNYGLDLLKGEVRDNIKAGVLEPTVSKVKSLKSALEAATSLLRIDDGLPRPLRLAVWSCRRSLTPSHAPIPPTAIQVAPEQRGGGGDDGHGH